MDSPTINIFRAIEEMRQISKAGGTFSLKFRKWDRQRHHGGDLCSVMAARVRPAAHDEQVADADAKLFFVDTETGRARVCWQPLIMEFNGMRTTF